MTRLSKLQKWILNRCLDQHYVHRDEARLFFGKKFGEHLKLWDTKIDFHREGVVVLERDHVDVNDYEPGLRGNRMGEEWPTYEPKKELCSTRTIEASISRSFGNLIKDGFLTGVGAFGGHFLTEAGFLKLTKGTKVQIVNTYSQYVETVNAENQEMAEHYKNLVVDLKKTMPGNKEEEQS